MSNEFSSQEMTCSCKSKRPQKAQNKRPLPPLLTGSRLAKSFRFLRGMYILYSPRTISGLHESKSANPPAEKLLKNGKGLLTLPVEANLKSAFTAICAIRQMRNAAEW